MHHTIAWFETIDNTANTDVNALADQIIPITNNHFLPYKDMQLFFAWVGSATLNRARFNSPRLRQITPSNIRPIDRSLLPSQDPNVMLLHDNPMRIAGQEELVLEATSGVAMTEEIHAIANLCDRMEAAPIGDIYTLRFTSTTTATADAWSLLTATYDTQLPVGTYDIVGGELQSTTAIAFRVILDDQYYRPGGLGISSLANRVPWIQYNGGWGRWGSFRTVSLPRIEALCGSADNAFEGYLQLIRRS